MNQNQVRSVLIEAQYFLEMLFCDDGCDIARKKIDVGAAQIAALQLVQRARQLYDRQDPSPLSQETLALVARLDTDAVIDNAKYMARKVRK